MSPHDLNCYKKYYGCSKFVKERKNTLIDSKRFRKNLDKRSMHYSSSSLYKTKIIDNEHILQFSI